MRLIIDHRVARDSWNMLPAGRPRGIRRWSASCATERLDGEAAVGRATAAAPTAGKNLTARKTTMIVPAIRGSAKSSGTAQNSTIGHISSIRGTH